MTKIKHVCSLGFNCHVAQMLKTNELKLASYPFDWIMSSLDVVKHCLQDDFKTYLDKDSYIELNGKCGHKVYCDNMFAHHNPLQNTNDYDYFVRCVGRFRKIISSEDNKLFIISIINGEHGVGNKLSQDLINQFMSLYNIINEKTKNAHLLVIVNYPNHKTNKAVITNNKNVTFLEIDTHSFNNGVCFDNDVDNKFLIKHVTKLYKFKLK